MSKSPKKTATKIAGQLDPDFYFQVGRVIREWGRVENSLLFLLCDLLGIDQFRARILLASIANDRAKTQMIDRLGATYIDPPLLPEFKRLMKRVNDLRLKRNIYAHGMLAGMPKEHEYLFLKDDFPVELKGTLAFKTQRIRLQDIKTQADGLTQLFNDLGRFGGDLSGNVHTSARTHREQLPHPRRNSVPVPRPRSKNIKP